MAEEEKPKQLIQMSTVFASGVTAIVAALFTSRLGVAGTLIGTALTPMLMTVGVAILNAQFQKASEKISDLPSSVRGRLSTQRVRVPGTPAPEEPPREEPTEQQPEPPRRRDRRNPGLVERVRSIPSFLREMSPTARRRTLLSGVLAGLVAAAIGLAGVTGIETALGGNLSCTLYEECANSSTSEAGAGTGTSLSRALGGSATETPVTGDEQPANLQQDGTPAPEDAVPSNGQYDEGPPSGQPATPSDGQQGLPADPTQEQQQQPDAEGSPEATPQDAPAQQPSAAPGAEEEAVPQQ